MPLPQPVWPLDTAANVDARGTMWRLRSLVAMGHDARRIAAALRLRPDVIQAILRGEAKTVGAGLRDLTCQLWDAWWDKRVMQHPAQEHNVGVVATLIGKLRSCRRLVDYDDLQRLLFHALHSVQEHQSEARRCAHRLARRKALPTPLPQLPLGANPSDPETWRIEDLVFDRICRQLRAVGDGIAWRVSGNDRRYVIAVSSNASPGWIAGKSGLEHELGAAAELRNRGSLGLLHDLTNCLRIGDITEFKPDGTKLLYEIKSSATAKTGPQRRRMEAAIQAVMAGGELPGRPGQRIVVPAIRCRTHIRTFAAGINAAMTHGIAAVNISDSRALTVVSFPTMARIRGSHTPAQSTADFKAQRQAAMSRAGIDAMLHHVRVASTARNHDFVPSVMPFALFPLPALYAALVICDYVSFDMTIAPERISSKLAAKGIATAVSLPPSDSTLVATDIVLTLSKGSRELRLHPGALYELLIETLDLDTWSQANADVLDEPDAPHHPVLALSTTRVWR